MFKDEDILNNVTVVSEILCFNYRFYFIRKNIRMKIIFSLIMSFNYQKYLYEKYDNI